METDIQGINEKFRVLEPILYKEPDLPDYLAIDTGRDGFMPFPRVMDAFVLKTEAEWERKSLNIRK